MQRKRSYTQRGVFEIHLEPHAETDVSETCNGNGSTLKEGSSKSTLKPTWKRTSQETCNGNGPTLKEGSSKSTLNPTRKRTSQKHATETVLHSKRGLRNPP